MTNETQSGNPMRMLVISALLLSSCVWQLRHVTPEGSTVLVKDDDLATVAVEPGVRSLRVTVTSKSDARMRVEWNEAVLIEPEGKSDPLVLGTTRKMNLGQPMPPGILYPRASLTDVVLPLSIVAKTRGFQAPEFGLVAEPWLGKPWRVVIPLYVDGSTTARLYEVTVVSTLPDAPK